MKFDKLKTSKNIYLLIGCLIILLISILNITKLHSIYVLADEFGYWTAASYFRGYDWSSIAAINPYYSFGYGILLSPLLWLQNGVLSYQCAIILNGLLLCFSFLLSYHCLSTLFNTVKTEYIACTSIAITLYSNNVGLSQTTMCECFLFFLFWCTFTCLLELCSKKSNKYIILYAISLGLMYNVHLRTLGIVIAGAMCLLLLMYKKIINWKQLILFILIFMFLLLAGNMIKVTLQNLYSSELTSNVNDYSGQIGKIKFLFTLDGIKSLIKSVCGKIWYLASSTYFLAFWFVVVCIKNIQFKKGFFSKNQDVLPFILIFSCLSLLATLGISSVFMIRPTRIDQLIYGRYNEFLLGPVLGITLCWLIKQSKHLFKENGIICGIYILLSVIIYKVYLNFEYSDINYTNIIGIYRFIQDDFSIISISIKCFFLGFILYLLIIATRKFLKNINWLHTLITILSLCLIAGIWTWQGIGYAQEKVYTYQEKLSDTVIADIINDIDTDKELPLYYIYNPESTTYVKNRIFTVQFLLKDKSIELMDYNTFTEFQNSLEEEAIYIINKNVPAISELNRQYNVLFVGNNLELFIDYDNPQRAVIEEAISKQETSITLSETSTNSPNENLQTFSFGKINIPGYYNLNMLLDFSDLTNLQTIRITLRTQSGNILDEKYIHNNKLNNHQIQVSMIADISFDNEQLELILSSEEPFDLTYSSASIRRLDNTVYESADSKSELGEISSMIKKMNIDDIYYITFSKKIGNLDIMHEILNGVTLHHNNYNDFLSSSDSPKYIIVKSETNIFDYKLLWENYCILAANDKYYFAVSNAEHEFIQNWVHQKNNILSNTSGISAKYFNYTEDITEGIYTLKDLSNRDYTCSLQFNPFDKTEEKIATIFYTDEIYEDIYYNDLNNGEYNFLIANGLGKENYIRIETIQNVSIKDLWLKESENGKIVEELYESILGRIPDQQGYREWQNWLNSGEITVIDLCRNLFLSEEFTARELNNEGYVKLLYSICLGKGEIDENYDTYVKILENGGLRSEILDIFLQSNNCILK